MELSIVTPTRLSRHTTINTTAAAISRIRGSSSPVTDSLPRSLVHLAQTVLWDPGDKAVRRFSEPAIDANARSLTAHISSARTAYAKAFVSIQQSAKNVDVNDLLITSTEKEVAELAVQLDARSASEEKGPMSRLVNVLHHYHDVFDVLSQADLSYLPLIWGGMKLILKMAKNRGDLLDKLADMLVEVGMSLSRIEVYTKLYPTARMVELTSILYAAVADFLQEVIATFQRSAVRQYFSSIVRPFEEKFGRLVERIHRLENSIQQDAALLHALQTASMAHHQLDSFLQRQHVEAALLGIPKGQLPQTDIFIQIKDTLFQGFEHNVDYHESLEGTYSVTAGAWGHWFKEEQKYLPSGLGPSKRLVQGICDAPDFQHALQWAAQQRENSPHIPSAYLIWAKGMTAHSAIASLIFQVLQQRPQAISEHNLDVRMFERANTSIKALWDVFVHLMRVLDGCLIYISMGSVGPDEFAVVEKFVKTVRDWDGLPIRVTIIHPYHEGFMFVDDVTDIDGIYDVHPSLTTTDALHHVLMLELGVREVSKTVQTVLWESLWRETRYTVVGISLKAFLDAVQSVADEVSQGLEKDKKRLWSTGMQLWMSDNVSINNVRELIQRHLDIIPLEPSDDMRAYLARHVKIAVLKVDSGPVETLGDRFLSQPQRDHIWGRMQAAISPGTASMFASDVRESIEDAIERFDEGPIGNDKQAVKMIRRLLDSSFGRESSWKKSFSNDKQLIIGGVADAIIVGFQDVLVALLEPRSPQTV